MADKPKPSPDSAARAAALHAEIDQLTGKTPTKDADDKTAGADDNKPSLSPRDYIQKYMTEHDKKPEK
jgi:hypothetical protein